MRALLAASLLLTFGCASAPRPKAPATGCSNHPCSSTSTWPCTSPQTECSAYQPPAPDAPPNPNQTCDYEQGLYCVAGCGDLPASNPSWGLCLSPRPAPCGLTNDRPATTTTFAVIGDWGDTICAHTCTETVAKMINRWDNRYGIDYLITTGDNNYPNGYADDLITEMELYSNFSPWPSGLPPGHCPPQPGDPPLQNPPRMFPTIGNHDVTATYPYPFLTYFCQFAAFGNPNAKDGPGRYYHYAPNNLIEIFAINSNTTEPDGIAMGSTQQVWIEEAMLASKARWKIVVFHEPPGITTSNHEKGDNTLLWDFKKWGASIVLMGHQHLYERIVDQDGLTWVVNGLGGTTGIASIRDDQGCTAAKGSQKRFNYSVGAMIGVATKDELRFCFMAADKDNPEGTCVDSFPVN